MLRSFIYIGLLTLLFACKKTKPEEVNPIVYPDYSNYKTGNYWIYQIFEIEQGRETVMERYDSIWVEKDTLINSKMYHMIGDNTYGYSFRRDSLHYIVDHAGKRLFSSQDFSATLDLSYMSFGQNDTAYKREIKMEAKKDDIVKTPAGDFKTLNVLNRLYYYPKYYSPLTLDRSYYKYAQNIGMVMQTYEFSFGSSIYTERRLLRYHIQK